MGLFDNLIDLAGTVLEKSNMLYEKTQKIQQFHDELEEMSDFELQCYYYACKGVIDERGINV